MPSVLGRNVGIELGLDDYYRDFESNFWQLRGFWKLERQQHFAEPGNPSWEAFSQGRWEEALRLIEEDRGRLREYHERLSSVGSFARRVRVVSLPLTAYLQWELHALKVRDETGGPIRVVDVSVVRGMEEDGPLPEVYTLGSELMYRANYDDNHVLASATKYTDGELVRRWRSLIEDLFAQGEPLADLFEREVLRLPPPDPGRQSVVDDYLERRGRPRPIKS